MCRTYHRDQIFTETPAIYAQFVNQLPSLTTTVHAYCNVNWPIHSPQKQHDNQTENNR